MNSRHFTSFAVATFTLVCALGARAADDSQGAVHSPAASLRTTSGAAFDDEFLSAMREHHRVGVQLATLAQQRAEREAVKRFAQRTATHQQQGLTQLAGLIGIASPDERSAHGIASSSTSGLATLPSGSAAATHAPGGMSTHGELNTGAAKQALDDDAEDTVVRQLEDARGEAFDSLFLDLISKHHRAGIELALIATARSPRPEVKQFARDAVREQKAELIALDDLNKR